MKKVDPNTLVSQHGSEAFFFLIPFFCPRITLALPPSSSSDPGSHSGPFFPLPTKVRAIKVFAWGIVVDMILRRDRYVYRETTELLTAEV